MLLTDYDRRCLEAIGDPIGVADILETVKKVITLKQRLPSNTRHHPQPTRRTSVSSSSNVSTAQPSPTFGRCTLVDAVDDVPLINVPTSTAPHTSVSPRDAPVSLGPVTLRRRQPNPCPVLSTRAAHDATDGLVRPLSMSEDVQPSSVRSGAPPPMSSSSPPPMRQMQSRAQEGQGAQPVDQSQYSSPSPLRPAVEAVTTSSRQSWQPQSSSTTPNTSPRAAETPTLGGLQADAPQNCRRRRRLPPEEAAGRGQSPAQSRSSQSPPSPLVSTKQGCPVNTCPDFPVQPPKRAAAPTQHNVSSSATRTTLAPVPPPTSSSASRPPPMTVVPRPPRPEIILPLPMSRRRHYTGSRKYPNEHPASPELKRRRPSGQEDTTSKTNQNGLKTPRRRSVEERQQCGGEGALTRHGVTVTAEPKSMPKTRNQPRMKVSQPRSTGIV